MGSSVADSNQFKKVANIIKDDPSRKFIVVSAPGKRYENDYKMTDLLIKLAEAFISKDKYKSYYITIMDRFQGIINELELSEDIVTSIENKLQSIMQSNLVYDDLMNEFKAVGEDSSAKILSAYLESSALQQTMLILRMPV